LIAAIHLESLDTFLTNDIGHPRRGRKPEFKQERYSPLDGASCVCPAWARCKWGSSPL
jgi:hypothetical protein